jgi:hypothetical protein
MSARRTIAAASAVLVIVVAAGVGIALWPVSTTAVGGLASSAPTPAPTREPVEPDSEPLTFAVVGDSISARTDREGVDQSAGSWTTYAADAELEFVENGWAQNGARLLEMQSNLSAVDADVLVILAGTNDLTSTAPPADRLLIVGQLAAQSGADRIVVAAVPPSDGAPAQSLEWNSALAGYASAMGWQFVDPWTAVRADDGRYVSGNSGDGIHPTPVAARTAGTEMRAALLGPDGIEA